MQSFAHIADALAFRWRSLVLRKCELQVKSRGTGKMVEYFHATTSLLYCEGLG